MRTPRPIPAPDTQPAHSACLRRGADPNTRAYLFPPGTAPVLSADNPVMAMGVALGADPHIAAKMHTTPLRRAAGVGEVAWVRQLLAAGVDPNLRGASGEAALIDAIAARHVRRAVLALLLRGGANVNIQHYTMRPVVDLARWLGCDDSAIDLLLAAAPYHPPPPPRGVFDPW